VKAKSVTHHLANTKKKAAQDVRTRSGAQHVRGATQYDARTSLNAAADTQVAEFERTFTLRYVWWENGNATIAIGSWSTSARTLKASTTPPNSCQETMELIAVARTFLPHRGFLSKERMPALWVFAQPLK
jgi:hypothetical protein